MPVSGSIPARPDMKSRCPARTATGNPATGTPARELAIAFFFIARSRRARLAGLAGSRENGRCVVAEDLAPGCALQPVERRQSAFGLRIPDVERIVGPEHHAVGARDLDREVDRFGRPRAGIEEQ